MEELEPETIAKMSIEELDKFLQDKGKTLTKLNQLLGFREPRV